MTACVCKLDDCSEPGCTNCGHAERHHDSQYTKGSCLVYAREHAWSGKSGPCACPRFVGVQTELF